MGLKNRHIMKKKYDINGRVVSVSATKQRASTALLGCMHYAYTIRIECDGKHYTTTFHDSRRNYLIGKGATSEMIDSAVDSLICDYDAYDRNQYLEDFLDEYGYGEIFRKEGEKAFKACRKTYLALKDMLTEKDLEELNAIVG